jgi:hypothetical protein
VALASGELQELYSLWLKRQKDHGIGI